MREAGRDRWFEDTDYKPRTSGLVAETLSEPPLECCIIFHLIRLARQLAPNGISVTPTEGGAFMWVVALVAVTTC